MKQNDKIIYTVLGLVFVAVFSAFFLPPKGKFVVVGFLFVLLAGLLIYGLSVKVYRERLKENLIMIILLIAVLGGSVAFSIYKIRV